MEYGHPYFSVTDIDCIIQLFLGIASPNSDPPFQIFPSHSPLRSPFPATHRLRPHTYPQNYNRLPVCNSRRDALVAAFSAASLREEHLQETVLLVDALRGWKVRRALLR